MSTFYRVEPVTDFGIFTTPGSQRKGSQFKASWTSTTEELERELDHLGARDVVLEIGVGARDIRKDGMLRADARPSHPGVRISFQSRNGELSFTCDTYERTYSWVGLPSWQANVRAILLTLQALRAVDRYGATQGEQYAGFKAIDSGSGATPLGAQPAMSVSDARRVVELHSGMDTGLPGSHSEAKAFRRARASAHPDRHDGDHTFWNELEEALKVLEVKR